MKTKLCQLMPLTEVDHLEKDTISVRLLGVRRAAGVTLWHLQGANWSLKRVGDSVLLLESKRKCVGLRDSQLDVMWHFLLLLLLKFVLFCVIFLLDAPPHK